MLAEEKLKHSSEATHFWLTTSSLTQKYTNKNTQKAI